MSPREGAQTEQASSMNKKQKSLLIVWAILTASVGINTAYYLVSQATSDEWIRLHGKGSMYRVEAYGTLWVTASLLFGAVFPFCGRRSMD